MPELMVQRGKRGVWYANCRYNGYFIRDSLGTSDRRLAERKLAELKQLVERGEYNNHKTTFASVVENYERDVLPKKNPSQRERVGKIIKIHLLPWFKDMAISDITENGAQEVHRFCEENSFRPKSTLEKHLRALKEILILADSNFKLPKFKFENLGKRFDETQILEEDQVLDIIENKVLPKYQIPSLISCYSGLRLGNVVGLKKKDVDLKSGFIVVAQTKTKQIVSIPITKKLRNVFSRIKVWPLKRDDLFFPDLDSKAMGIQVSRSFSRSGISWATFHHFRHFTACYLINNGVRLEIVQKIMGHKDIKSTLVYARIKREVLVDAMKVFDAGCTQSVHKNEKSNFLPCNSLN